MARIFQNHKVRWLAFRLRILFLSALINLGSSHQQNPLFHIRLFSIQESNWPAVLVLVVGAPIKSDHTLSVATDGKDSFSNKSFNLITGGRYAGAVSYAISSSRTNGKKNSQARSLNLPNKNQLHFPSRYLFPTLAHLWDFRQIFFVGWKARQACHWFGHRVSILV